MATYQILVKLIDGHTRCIQFPSPTLTGQTLKQALTLGPNVRLVTGTLELADETLIAALSPSNLFPSVALLPRLRGGKGGFGSLLRGAATKAGQKKTNNFDACRDMSGRRLRHVNAEKKLEEWKAEADDRRMEKLAEEFLKKKAKETKKGKGKNGEIEKYLEKCRRESERCMDAVDQSVRESFALYQDGKRKVLPAAGGSVSKRMKIWMGKKKVVESDSDDEEEEEEDDKEKSMVLDDAICTALDKEEEGSSAAVLGCANSDGESSGRLSEALDNEEDGTSAAVLGCANSDGESSGRLSEKSNLEEVNGSPSDEHSSDGASNNCNLSEVNEKCEFELPTAKQYCAAGDSNAESDALVETEMCISEEVTAARNSVMSTIEEVPEIKDIKPVAEMSIDPEIINKETIVKIASILEEPLDFDNYNSSVELEALGMERLKSELQSRGMKCGGTLQERAARLFLLKTTPFEKLPKKVLAAKTGGK